GVQAVRIDSGLATVSAVGSGMRYTPGVAARMFTALAGATVRIENISTSEIRISVVVNEADATRAAACIHEAFGLSEGGGGPEIHVGNVAGPRAEA
ncbi:MAG: ACT domain-containing protein, partial [Phycisphaerales bacterium]|nr:ACT domain-containing protein [Phycisphaerales bacterium]